MIINENNYLHHRNSMRKAAAELRDRARDEIDREMFEGRDYDGDRLFWRGLYTLMYDMNAVLEVSKYDDDNG